MIAWCGILAFSLASAARWGLEEAREAMLSPKAIEIYVAKFSTGFVDNYSIEDQESGANTLYVTEQTTVADIIARVNYYPLRSGDDINNAYRITDMEVSQNEGFVYDVYEDMWRPDFDGEFFSKHADEVHKKGRSWELFEDAYYMGRILNPRGTLKENGVKDKSLLLLRPRITKQEGAKVELEMTKEFDPFSSIYVPKKMWLSLQDADDEWNLITLTPYRGESLWNLYNEAAKELRYARGNFYITINEGRDDQFSCIAVKSKNGRWRMLMWHHSDDSTIMANPKLHLVDNPTKIMVLLEQSGWTLGHLLKDGAIGIKVKKFDIYEGSCKCMNAKEYPEKVAKFLNKKQNKEQWGLGCKAHDSTKKYCTQAKLRAKGDRDCWCPLKWCYTTEECGTPSKTNPGTFYSYELPECQQGTDQQCYTRDEKGEIEEQDFGNMDIWSFTTLQDYLTGFYHTMLELEDDLVEKLSGLQAQFRVKDDD